MASQWETMFIEFGGKKQGRRRRKQLTPDTGQACRCHTSSSVDHSPHSHGSTPQCSPLVSHFISTPQCHPRPWSLATIQQGPHLRGTMHSLQPPELWKTSRRSQTLAKASSIPQTSMCPCPHCLLAEAPSQPAPAPDPFCGSI